MARDGGPSSWRQGPGWWERSVLLVAGLGVFVLGAWVHRDRATLALALVVVGAVLALLGLLLPYLQELTGSVGGVTLEISLAQLPSSIPQQPLGELRGQVLPDSGTRAFAALLRNPAQSIYSLVSLGNGQEWLTSRLLVFATVLRKLRGVRCLVITAWSGDDGVDRLVGTLTPEDLRRAFSWEYPWLEAAVAEAWERITGPIPGSKRGILNPQTADRLLHDVTHKLTSSAASDPQGDPEWVNVRGRNEHARWVDVAVLGLHLAVLSTTVGSRSARYRTPNPIPFSRLGGNSYPSSTTRTGSWHC
jgi:hypothetical protein